VSKIRVLRLISRLNIGGPAHHVLLLTKHLPADRYETLLVAGQEPAGELRAEKWAAQHQAPVYYLPALRRTPNLWHDLLALWQLYRLIRTYKPHILHTHTAKAGALGRLAGWMAGVPIRIHTFHGHSLYGYFPAPVSWAYRWIERLLARLSTRLITISPALQTELVERFRIAPPERFTVIRLGFEMERWAQYDVEKARLWRQSWAPHGETLLAWIGRMVPIKQVETLLEAATPLIHTGMPLKLLLVGEGPERPRLQRLSHRLNIADACLWPGPIEDMPTLYRAIDAVALPSRNEGTPVVLIEALACGVPVIAAAVGGVPDVLNNGQWGYLVPPQTNWTSALQNFLSQLPYWKTQAQAAQPHILATYDYRRLIHDITSLYESLWNSHSTTTLSPS
jgi:glycosyltransferase involved in cell wall biosynthesis